MGRSQLIISKAYCLEVKTATTCVIAKVPSSSGPIGKRRHQMARKVGRGCMRGMSEDKFLNEELMKELNTQADTLGSESAP